MTAERFYRLCRTLPGVTEDVKWGDNLVFSVGGKMFAVFDLPDGHPFSFKVAESGADAAAFAFARQEGIRAAPYLAKHGWLQVERLDTLPPSVVEDLIESSHALVAAKLSLKRRRELGIETPRPDP